MEELNELIESILVDIGEEGLGASAGIGLLWGIFFVGGVAGFEKLINLLVSMV